MTKIAHFILDEKVTENIIENFQKVTDYNIFYILGDKNNLKYLKIFNNNIIILNEKEFVISNIDSEINAVIVHSLHHVFSKVLLELDSSIKVAWFAWGYDIYDSPKIIKNLYGKKTLSLIKHFDKTYNVKHIIKNIFFLRKIYYKIFSNTIDYYSLNKEAYKKINFFCSYIKEDYEIFSKYNSNNIEFFETIYFSIDQYLAGLVDLSIKNEAKDILIGNSNSYENNHLEVIDILKQTEFEGKVICPLNYGDNIQYRDLIIKLGNNFLGDRFTPLVNFLSREEYLLLLSNCSTAIFYHFRQQAMGNIIALLFLGIRIYFSSKNPVYSYLVRLGISVYDFDKDFIVFKNSILDAELQNKNREIIEKKFSNCNIHFQYNSLIKKLLQ